MMRTRDFLIGIAAYVIAALIILYLIGCATQQTAKAKSCNQTSVESCPIVDCTRLLEQRDNAQLAGKILAGVGGVSALATAPESIPDAGRWGIGAGAATAAAASIGVLWYGERKSDEFERYCEVAEDDEALDALAPNPFGADGGVE